MAYIVYQHVFPNKKSYVGITNQRPERRWRKGEGYKYNTRMFRAIKKFGWDNIKHIILANGLTLEEASLMEIRLIAEQNLMDSRYGYNLASGGSHPEHSEATKRKIGIRSKGRKHTEEFKHWISEKNSGENNFMYGKHHSETTKKKISESKKGTPSINKGKYGSSHPSSKIVAGIDPTTNEIVVQYGSVIDASEGIGRSKSCLQAALHGQQHTCAGLKWVYL